MSVTPKRRCTDSLEDVMNDSLENRIKRISIEGNIGKGIFHKQAKRGRIKPETIANIGGKR